MSTLQQINLLPLPSSSQVPAQWRDTMVVVILFATLFVVLTGLTLSLQSAERKSQQQVDALRQHSQTGQEQVLSRIDAGRDIMATADQNPIVRARSAIAWHERRIAFFNQALVEARTSRASLLKSLRPEQMEGLVIQRVSMAGRGYPLTVETQLNSPGDIPRYLDYLSTQTPFVDRLFEALALEPAQADQAIRVMLQMRPPAESTRAHPDGIRSNAVSKQGS